MERVRVKIWALDANGERSVVLATLSPDERWFLRPERWDVPEVALGTQVQLEVADN